jgi:hypothetical protein
MSTQQVRAKRFATSAIAAEVGVEPELYSPAPRRVVFTRSTQKVRAWCANILVGILLLGYYCGTRGLWPGNITTNLMIFGAFAAFYCIICWGSTEVTARRSRFLLEQGFGVRATVELCEVSETAFEVINVRYSYTAIDGKEAGGHLTVSAKENQKLGGFAKGTAFTLLLHPTERYETLPYFQVSGAEIPGAAPARTTPP